MPTQRLRDSPGDGSCGHCDEPYVSLSRASFSCALKPMHSIGAEATLKRFWKDVGIEKQDGGYAVTLDKRPLKTPSGKRLIVPPEKRLVAALIASEWENQQTVLKPHALPMVSLGCLIGGVLVWLSSAETDFARFARAGRFRGRGDARGGARAAAEVL